MGFCVWVYCALFIIGQNCHIDKEVFFLLWILALETSIKWDYRRLWLRWGVWMSKNVRTALALYFTMILGLLKIIKNWTHPEAHMLSDCKGFAYPIKHTHSERAPLQLWGVFKSCSEAHSASWASHSPALPSASSPLPSRPLALEWPLSPTGSGSIPTRACVGLFNIHCDQLSPFD